MGLKINIPKQAVGDISLPPLRKEGLESFYVKWKNGVGLAS